jgi:hypothetical protein
VKRLIAVVAGLALALIGSVAVAAWLSTGSATATATATAVNQANAPTVTRSAGSVGLSWTASTLASGASVGGYQVLRHHGSDTPVEVCSTATTSCTDTAPLASAVSYGVGATIGANWRGPESTLSAFTYDNVAPVTTANVSPAPNAATWNNTAVTVDLQASDSGSPNSGVDHLSYTVDGDSAVVVDGATTSFAVSGAGTHTIGYFAVDAAGNAETPHSLTVRIDPSAPATTVTRSVAPNGGGWNNTDVTLDFSAVDTDASGVKSVTVDGATTSGSTASKVVSAEGTTTVSYFATDNADNVEGTNTTTVEIDRTGPAGLAITPASSTTWRSSGTVSLSASDALSGLASIEYKVDGAPSWTTYTAPFTLTDGSHTVDYRATDLAGNVTNAPQATIKVDTVLPGASLSQTGNGQPTISGTDATSGVASVSWRDGGSGGYTTVSSTSTSLSLPNGSHTIWYYATDNAGNQSSPASLDITIGSTNTAPGFVSSYPAQDQAFNGNGTNVWNTAPCGSLRVCTTWTDDTGVLSITFTLTTGSLCWNGATFGSGPCAPNGMSLNSGTMANGTWRSDNIIPMAQIQAGGSGVGRTYTLTYTATDGTLSTNKVVTFTGK